MKWKQLNYGKLVYFINRIPKKYEQFYKLILEKSMKKKSGTYFRDIFKVYSVFV